MGAPESRRRILVGATEHKAVLEAAYAAERFGYSVELIPVDGDGFIDPLELKRRLDKSVAVVSVMLVNNEIGTIQDVGALSVAAHSVGALFHTDAAQAPLAGGDRSLIAVALASHILRRRRRP